MTYKIAAASSDNIHVDQTFGGASVFTIVEVTDHGKYAVVEQRKVLKEEPVLERLAETCQVPATDTSGCGTGCHSGCGTGGCGVGKGESKKVSMISDCRCIVCRKIGFQVQKQLEKKAIIGFDVTCTMEEALRKIVLYFERVDHHQTLRGMSQAEK